MESLLSTIASASQDMNRTFGSEYGRVTRLRVDKTVDVVISDINQVEMELSRVPIANDLKLEVNDNVIVHYLDNNPASPVVIGMYEPRSSSGGEDGRGIVSIDKVETVGNKDTYRITYSKPPTYSYFEVTNGTGGGGSIGLPSFEIRGDNLFMRFYTETPPNMMINSNGHLIYTHGGT